MSEASNRVIIDFFGDYVCPFSYLTVPVLYAAQERLADAIEVNWFGLELCPDPLPRIDPTTPGYAQQWREQVEPIAIERGLAPVLPSQMPRTRRAMEAASFARAAGRFDAMHRALFSAFFEHGRDISQIDELVRIGAEAGCDPAALRLALVQERYRAQVVADRQQAALYGVQGVPVMILRRAGQTRPEPQALWGAQPLEGVLKGVEIVRSGG